MNAEQQISAELARHWQRFVVAGTLALLLGAVAILVPALASVATAIFVGWILIVAGGFLIASAFSFSGASRVVLRLLWALLTVGAGLYLVLAPLRGTVTLTFVLCLYFIVIGLTRLWVAFAERGTPGVGWIGINGLFSLLIGLLIVLELPSSADWAIGLLVGIDLIFAGWALVVTGLGGRDLARSAH